MKNYISSEGLLVLVVVAVLIGVSALCHGCAAEISSTDNHHRLPQFECTMIKYQGVMREICCEGERCVLTE